MKPVRVLVVDDHALSRRGIAAIVQQDPGFRVIGEAADGEEALRKVRELAPDLVLMDIRMPRVNGLEATRRIKREHPQVVIVILSVSGEAQDLFEAVKAGAQGYLLKDLHPEHWLDYLRAVVKGDNPVPRELAEQLLHVFRNSDESGRRPPAISEREFEVLYLVADGLNNREIGERLNISESTVKNHLRNILEKLQLRNRAQLVAYAYERGWLRPRERSPLENG